MRQRGHTLYELMISLAVITILSGLCATIVASAREDDRIARAYVEDLRHVRDASDRLAQEVRSAGDVAVVEGGIVIDGRTWSVRDCALRRGDDVVVRGISRLEVEELKSDRVWRIAIAPTPRRAGAHAPSVLVTARRRSEALR